MGEFHMKLVDTEAKEQLLRRLRRIEGQVRGVQSMVEEERDCREILQQFTAIRAALQSASMAFVEEYASRCLLADPAPEPAQREQLLKDLMVLLGKVS
jgi:CsoR family transcriptional regulator, copper-sensing transcriptional repressor